MSPDSAFSTLPSVRRLQGATPCAGAASRLGRILFSSLVIAACDASTAPEEIPLQEVGVVVNSGDRSLTIFRVEEPNVRTTVGLGPDGSPVTLAVRGGVAVVPLGTVPAAVIVDLAEARVAHTVALPEGSGATGVAFANDSIALVANANLNTVSQINVRTGARGAEIGVGRFPQAALSVNDTVFVLNGELGPDFQPVGAGTVSVIAGSPLRVVRTITLRGTNPGGAAQAPGGRIYVINSGRFGRSEGTLSVIDRGTLTEASHHAGFLSFPGSVAAGADGRVYVGGFGIGVLVWSAQSSAFIHGAANPIAPGDVRSTSGVALDSAGRLYALRPECQTPGVAYRFLPTFLVETSVPVGICPMAIAFTQVASR